MMCECCKNKEAVVVLKATCEGKVEHEVYVCEDCAANYVEFVERLKRYIQEHDI